MKKILTATVLAAVMLCIVQALPAQDSLHLAMTLTGESYAKRITDAVGVGDVNGDGYYDFAVSRLGSVRLYLGGAKFDTSRFVEFNTGGNVAGAGDVNGDGYDDILIASQFNSGGERKGIVRLYLGNRNIDTTADFSFYDTKTGMDAMGSVSGAGDVNGDGYDDFLIGEPYNWTDATGKAYLFLGGMTLPAEPAVTFVSDSVGDNFGYSVRGIGDVNRDGFDDIAISALIADQGHGSVSVYLGGKVISDVPFVVLRPTVGGIEFGQDIEKVGDINSDGHDDFIVNVNSQYRVYIYMGLDSIIHLDSSRILFVGFPRGGGGGDINNDGYNDFLISNPSHKDADSVMVGAAYVLLGGAVIDTIPKLYVEGETKWSGFGYSVFFLGDYNGDGYDEVAVLAPNYPDTTGSGEACLGKVYIYSYKKIDAIKNRQGPLDPESFHLKQNYPNPFNPTTTIKFALPTQSQVTMTIYDILGREVKELVNDRLQAGYYHFSWNASMYATGVYFYRIVAQSLSGDRRSFVKVKKLLLLK